MSPPSGERFATLLPLVFQPGRRGDRDESEDLPDKEIYACGSRVGSTEAPSPCPIPSFHPLAAISGTERVRAAEAERAVKPIPMKYCLMLLSALLLAVSCNKDNTLTALPAPRIVPDSETGVYTVKVGRTLTIAPEIEHGENALYEWVIDGRVVGAEARLTRQWPETGVYYVTFRVRTKGGKAEAELRVDVLERTPPIISLLIPAQGLKAVAGVDYVLAPKFAYDDLGEFTIEWERDGSVVSTQRSYTFREPTPGVYPLTIRAANEDGASERRIDIEVVETLPLAAEFPTPSYFQTATDRYTFAGRPVLLEPRTSYFERPRFAWSVDGQTIEGATDGCFEFVPDAPGAYRVTVTVTEGASAAVSQGAASPGAARRLSREGTRGAASATASVTVHCVSRTEAQALRAKTAASSKTQHRVFEWTPAPGQFIGETGPIGGMTGSETTLAAANAWAEKRLAENLFVSLGGFGGYIVVGFDHSIVRGGGPYDFAVAGNAFPDSSEPGIVWVMQDVNGNGLPDDEWYELKGSETGREGTIRDYAVTYYRPAGKEMNVEWTDSEGNSGHIDYMRGQHRQEFYYPAWIEADSYTLRGTLLPAANRIDPTTGYWSNTPFAWGYADNYGSDRIGEGSTVDGSGHRNGFRIEHALRADGTPADLQYIDFVRVQVGVNAKSGGLGEISTEVCGFEDCSM